MDEGKHTMTDAYPPLLIVNSIWQVTKGTSGYVINYMTKCGDLMFSPSRGITVVGFLPFVGNVANFGMAVRAYIHGETWYGHQKMLEAVVGTSLDVATVGSATGGWQLAHVGLRSANLSCFCAGSRILITDLAQHTVTRLGALYAVHNIMNPPYHKY